MSEAVDVIQGLTDEFSARLLNSDVDVSALIAQTNLEGVELDTPEILKAAYADGSESAIDFELSYCGHGSNHPNRPYAGSGIRFLVSGEAVRHGTNWEIETYEVTEPAVDYD